ncbi:unnamed protein product [Prorocentrum cordatum]|uniref:Uncharacterized protein n=1 Tax=Prorocentrum cordatum TaxID=2364126 RepID=A0ABN9UPW4_9DINO|nr:unnamed protein product [Polarella glacialis]
MPKDIAIVEINALLAIAIKFGDKQARKQSESWSKQRVAESRGISLRDIIAGNKGGLVLVDDDELLGIDHSQYDFSPSDLEEFTRRKEIPQAGFKGMCAGTSKEGGGELDLFVVSSGWPRAVKRTTVRYEAATKPREPVRIQFFKQVANLQAGNFRSRPPTLMSDQIGEFGAKFTGVQSVAQNVFDALGRGPLGAKACADFLANGAAVLGDASEFPGSSIRDGVTRQLQRESGKSVGVGVRLCYDVAWAALSSSTFAAYERGNDAEDRVAELGLRLHPSPAINEREFLHWQIRVCKAVIKHGPAAALAGGRGARGATPASAVRALGGGGPDRLRRWRGPSVVEAVRGPPVEELAAEVTSLSSNRQRDLLTTRLLALLRRAGPGERAERLQGLALQVFAFHEDPAVGALMRAGARHAEAGELEAGAAHFRAVLRVDPEDFTRKPGTDWRACSTTLGTTGPPRRRARAGRWRAAAGALRGPGWAGPRRAAGPAPRRGGGGVPGREGASARLLLGVGADAQAAELADSAQALATALASAALATIRAAPTSVVLLVSAAMLGIGGLGGDGGQIYSPWSTRVDIQTEQSTAELAPGVTQFKFSRQVVRTTRTGAPLSDLQDAVSKLETNAERRKTTARLLDELSVCTDARRSAAISDLVWRAWLFHESPVVQSLIAGGQECLSQGDLFGAEKLFMSAAYVDPSYAEAWNRLATVHYLMGDQALSLAEIRQTLDLEPLHFGALSGRGLVFLQLERYGDAAEAFREARAVMPASPNLAADAEFADEMAERAEAASGTSP